MKVLTNSSMLRKVLLASVIAGAAYSSSCNAGAVAFSPNGGVYCASITPGEYLQVSIYNPMTPGLVLATSTTKVSGNITFGARKSDGTYTITVGSSKFTFSPGATQKVLVPA